jgi:hypothetical protein
MLVPERDMKEAEDSQKTEVLPSLRELIIYLGLGEVKFSHKIKAK